MSSSSPPGSLRTLPHSLPRGYHKLAALMSQHGEAAIFRKFCNLNMLNLLSLQAELVHLEAELRIFREDDDVSQLLGERGLSSSFFALRNSEGTENAYQWNKLLEIRSKLKEYNEALIQVAQVTSLDSAERDNVKFLREWLLGENEGNGFLVSNEAFTWDATSDLVSLRKNLEEKDDFSRFIGTYLLDMWHDTWGHRSKIGQLGAEAGAFAYSSKWLNGFGTFIATILSSMLPLLAVLVLYFVKETLQRIYVMLAFTLTFASSLAIFISARRIEIFASTAAFAAVEVVFIGSAN